VDTPHDTLALSPSIDNQGDITQAVGGPGGPFVIMVGAKAVTPSGLWAAMPSFCSTASDRRVVFMVRTGNHWEVRIASVGSGAARTVIGNAMSPACSPDGRTVAVWSAGRSGKGPGIYLVSDQGGTPRKVWTGKAAGLRWGVGEPLPKRVAADTP
jgi:TolB protein